MCVIIEVHPDVIQNPVKKALMKYILPLHASWSWNAPSDCQITCTASGVVSNIYFIKEKKVFHIRVK